MCRLILERLFNFDERTASERAKGAISFLNNLIFEAFGTVQCSYVMTRDNDIAHV